MALWARLAGTLANGSGRRHPLRREAPVREGWPPCGPNGSHRYFLGDREPRVERRRKVSSFNAENRVYSLVHVVGLIYSRPRRQPPHGNGL